MCDALSPFQLVSRLVSGQPAMAKNEKMKPSFVSVHAIFVMAMCSTEKKLVLNVLNWDDCDYLLSLRKK